MLLALDFHCTQVINTNLQFVAHGSVQHIATRRQTITLTNKSDVKCFEMKKRREANRRKKYEKSRRVTPYARMARVIIVFCVRNRTSLKDT